MDRALQSYEQEIEKSYISAIHALFHSMVALHGPLLNGVSNCPRYARAYRECLAGVIIREMDDRRQVVSLYIDDQKMAIAASAYAKSVINQWRDKIVSKIGELDDAKVVHLSGGNFTITGMKKGKHVRIEQQMIFKMSKHNLPFNQFPARIYLDGKFISEAKYKKDL